MMRARAGTEPPIIQYWHNAEVPGEVAELIATFADRNPGRPHLVFDEVEAEGFIAERHSAREVEAFRACAVPAMQADYFRYCAVLALGGAYADVGFRCIAPLSPLFDGVGGVLFRRDPPGYLLNGFFVFSEPGHPLLRLALDIATTNIERRASEMVQMVTGPVIFSSLSVLHRLGSLDAHRQDIVDGRTDRLEEPFRRGVAALALTRAGRGEIERMAQPILEAVGDYARVARAFEGVHIAPLETMTEHVRQPEEQLGYKTSESYWMNWQRHGASIFR